jgi:penicillin-binding protein 1A
MKKYQPKPTRMLHSQRKYSPPRKKFSLTEKFPFIKPFIESLFFMLKRALEIIRKIPLGGVLLDLLRKAADFISDLPRIWRSFVNRSPRVRTFINKTPLKNMTWSARDIDRLKDISVDSVADYISQRRKLFIRIGAGIIIFFLAILMYDFYRVQSLAKYQPNITTKIYDKNGLLVSELFRQKREVIPYKKIPQHLKDAFVAVEDREFYEHNGINIKGIVRAFFINLSSGRVRQGGSTITQQLSKILLTSGERSIYRKIKEAFISIMMEFSFSKEEILGLYLNQIFLGHGTYGVESASQIYFEKHVWELNLAESSLLATLPSAPNLLSPIRYPKRSMQRHKIVLAKMVEAGYITVPEAEKAYLEFWPDYLDYISNVSPSRNAWSNRIDEAPWFTEYVRRRLVKEFGEEKVYEEGLQVYTTLDLNKQKAAQKLLADALERQTSVSSTLIFDNEEYFIKNFSDVLNLFTGIFDVPQYKRKGSRLAENTNDYFQSEMVDELDGLSFLAGMGDVNLFLERYRRGFLMDKDYQKVEGCLISIDHRTGYIEALVGGGEFSSINQLNRAMQSRRQPGSAIKPLLYATGFETGDFTPGTAVLDSPIVYLDNEGGDWLPENYEGEYYGMVRLRKALAKSINVVSVRIAEKVGIERVMKSYGKFLGIDPGDIKNRIPRNFSIALGSFEVTPYELTRAYAIIANGGRYVLPYSIRYVKDRKGEIILNDEEMVRETLRDREADGTMQIIKPETAQVMISMLRDVVEWGTGSAASPQRPAGGKTGTTNSWKDAWFVGFTPELTTGIWMGYDKLGMSLGIGQTGGGVVAPVWGEYMREALENEPVIDFPHYAGLVESEICERTGLLPSSNCRTVIKEVFIPGTVPEEECTLCTGNEEAQMIKGPRENISEKQKKAILNNMKSDTENTIIDNISNDLL